MPHPLLKPWGNAEEYVGARPPPHINSDRTLIAENPTWF